MFLTVVLLTFELLTPESVLPSMTSDAWNRTVYNYYYLDFYFPFCSSQQSERSRSCRDKPSRQRASSGERPVQCHEKDPIEHGGQEGVDSRGHGLAGGSLRRRSVTLKLKTSSADPAGWKTECVLRDQICEGGALAKPHPLEWVHTASYWPSHRRSGFVMSLHTHFVIF